MKLVRAIQSSDPASEKDVVEVVLLQRVLTVCHLLQELSEGSNEITI